MRLTVINQKSGTETVYHLGRGTWHGGIGQYYGPDGLSEQQLVWQRSRIRTMMQRAWRGLRERGRHYRSPERYSIELRNDRYSVRVLDRGDGETIFLAEQPLAVQQEWTWPQEQFLRVGDLLLVWEQTKSAKRPWFQPLPLERLTWRMLLLAILLLLIPVGYRTYGAYETRWKIVQTPFALAPTATLTRTTTPIPTATTTFPPTPTPTFTATATATPERVTMPLNDGIVAMITPTPTETSVPAKATEEAAQITCVDTRQMEPDRELQALQIRVLPACVRIGEAYWQLTELRWLDAEESNGLHHIFVKVFDIDSRAAVGTHVIMRWETGDCTREVRDDAGINCAMFNAGSAYSVQVDGLPSEQVINLGLGTVDERETGFRTSFQLKFQKTIRTGL